MPTAAGYERERAAISQAPCLRTRGFRLCGAPVACALVPPERPYKHTGFVSGDQITAARPTGDPTQNLELHPGESLRRWLAEREQGENSALEVLE